MFGKFGAVYNKSGGFFIRPFGGAFLVFCNNFYRSIFWAAIVFIYVQLGQEFLTNFHISRSRLVSWVATNIKIQNGQIKSKMDSSLPPREQTPNLHCMKIQNGPTNAKKVLTVPPFICAAIFSFVIHFFKFVPPFFHLCSIFFKFVLPFFHLCSTLFLLTGPKLLFI